MTTPATSPVFAPEQVRDAAYDAYINTQSLTASGYESVAAAADVAYAASRAALTAELTQVEAVRDDLSTTLAEVDAALARAGHQSAVHGPPILITNLTAERDYARRLADLTAQDQATTARLRDEERTLRQQTEADRDRYAAAETLAAAVQVWAKQVDDLGPRLLLGRSSRALYDAYEQYRLVRPVPAAPSSVPPPARREPELSPDWVPRVMAVADLMRDWMAREEPDLHRLMFNTSYEELAGEIVRAGWAGRPAAPTGPVADTTVEREYRYVLTSRSGNVHHGGPLDNLAVARAVADSLTSGPDHIGCPPPVIEQRTVTTIAGEWVPVSAEPTPAPADDTTTEA